MRTIQINGQECKVAPSQLRIQPTWNADLTEFTSFSMRSVADVVEVAPSIVAPLSDVQAEKSPFNTSITINSDELPLQSEEFQLAFQNAMNGLIALYDLMDVELLRAEEPVD